MLNSNLMTPIARLSFLGLVCATCMMLTGCSSLDSLASKKVPVVENSVQSGQYRVEMHSSLGKAKPYVGTIAGDMTVQDALESSGAIKKYRAMDIEVLRVVDTQDSGPRGLRMKVNFESRYRSVMPEQNYSLHNGDRIVIKPLNKNPLSKVVGMLGQQSE